MSSCTSNKAELFDKVDLWLSPQFVEVIILDTGLRIWTFSWCSFWFHWNAMLGFLLSSLAKSKLLQTCSEKYMSSWKCNFVLICCKLCALLCHKCFLLNIFHRHGKAEIPRITMETGGLRADKDTESCYADGLGNLSSKTDSQVFDLVIDPLTDFKVGYCTRLYLFVCV